MAFQGKQWLTPGIAQLSHLIEDDAEDTAAVVELRPDYEVCKGRT